MPKTFADKTHEHATGGVFLDTPKDREPKHWTGQEKRLLGYHGNSGRNMRHPPSTYTSTHNSRFGMLRIDSPADLKYAAVYAFVWVYPSFTWDG